MGEFILRSIHLPRLRELHMPVQVYVGTFDHGWVHQAQRVVPRFRTPDNVLRWVMDQLPAHVPDDRYPNSCSDVCDDVELEGPVCRTCGGGLNEDGEWCGTLWPCPTAELLDIDLEAPGCTCRYVDRRRGDHDRTCLYAAFILGTEVGAH